MCANKVDKPARLIIKLSFGFVSDSVSRKKQMLRRQRCLQQGRVGITLDRFGTEKTGYSASEFWLHMKVRKLIRLSINP